MSSRLPKTMQIRIRRDNMEGSFVVRISYQPPFQMRKWAKFPFKQLEEMSVSSSSGLQETLTSLTSAARADHWDPSNTGGVGVGVCWEQLLITEAG